MQLASLDMEIQFTGCPKLSDISLFVGKKIKDEFSLANARGFSSLDSLITHLFKTNLFLGQETMH